MSSELVSHTEPDGVQFNRPSPSMLTTRNRLVQRPNTPRIRGLAVGLVCAICLILFINKSEAASRYWVASAPGNWSNTANWSTTSGGSGGSTVPGSSDVAFFDAARVGNCAINASPNVAGISVSGYTGTITQNSGFTITVGATGYSQSSGTFSGGNSTITLNGAYTLSAGTFTTTSGSTNVNANWTISGGTFNANSGTVVFGATLTITGSQTLNNVTMSGSSTKTLAGNLSILGNLNISNGTFVMGSYTANRTAAGGTLTLASGATLSIGGTNSLPSNYSTHSIGATSVVDYAGTNQTVVVPNSAQNYGNLTISGSGTKTLAGTVGVARNLTVSAGTFDLGSFTANRAAAGGTLTVSNGATLTIGGTNTLPSNYNTHSIGATSTINYAGSNQTVAVLNGPQNYGHLTLSGSGTKTLEGTEVVRGDLTISAGTFDLGSFTINRSAAGGTLTIANGAGLNIGGTNTIPSNYSTHVIGATSTVNYSGSNQSVSVLNSSQNYGHLTISGSGTKTLAGTVGVAGDLTISAGTFTLGTFTANRTAAGGTLTVANGATLSIGGTNTIPANYSAHVVGATSTINYTGTNQTVAVLNSSQDYGHLTLSGSGTKTLGGGITVRGTLSISGASLADGGYTLIANGDISNSTSHTGTGKIMLSGGSSPHALSGGGSYTNLHVNGALGVTMSSSVTVNGTLTLTSGNITTGAYTISISSTGIVSRASGYVIGNFQKYVATGAPSTTFEIGDASNYTPADVSFSGVSTGGNLTAFTTAGDHPNISTANINPAKSINRYWTLTNSGIVFASCSATFNFVAGDLDAGTNTNAVIVGKWSAGAWGYPTVGTRNATSTQATNLTSFGDFQVGEAPVLSVSVSNGTFAFGINLLNTWLAPQTSTILNDGNVAEILVGRISQFSDGSNNWGISTVSNGSDIIRAQWSTTSATGPWVDISAYDADFTLASNVGVGSSVTVWLRLQTPTGTSSYNQHSSVLTATAQKY